MVIRAEVITLYGDACRGGLQDRPAKTITPEWSPIAPLNTLYLSLAPLLGRGGVGAVGGMDGAGFRFWCYPGSVNERKNKRNPIRVAGITAQARRGAGGER